MSIYKGDTLIAGDGLTYTEDSIGTAINPLDDYYNKSQTDALFTNPTLTSSSLTAGGKAGTKYVGSHIVVESWKATDGTMWYRKYSDGWKECGGQKTLSGGISGSGEGSEHTIDLPITFSNSNYTVSLQDKYVSSGGGRLVWYLYTQSTTSFIAVPQNVTSQSISSGASKCYWYACGY